MNRKDARTVARLLAKADHFNITICEPFPSNGEDLFVTSLNGCAMRRSYSTTDEARMDLR